MFCLLGLCCVTIPNVKHNYVVWLTGTFQHFTETCDKYPNGAHWNINIIGTREHQQCYVSISTWKLKFVHRWVVRHFTSVFWMPLVIWIILISYVWADIFRYFLSRSVRDNVLQKHLDHCQVIVCTTQHSNDIFKSWDVHRLFQSWFLEITDVLHDQSFLQRSKLIL